MNKEKKIKMLFIASGPAAPGTSESDNPFFYLSEYFSGYIIGSTWPGEKAELERYIEKIQPSFKNFKYLPFISTKRRGFIKQLIHLYQYYKKSTQVLKSEKIDIICSYGFFVPGIVSAFLSKKHNIPLLIEVPGVPGRAIEFSNLKFKRLAKLIQDITIKFCISQTKAIWLLYKDQLKNYVIPRDKKVYISHEFSPIKMFSPNEISSPIISFLGHPWKLKGVDILIEAFKLILPKHPTAKLRIAGYCPDRHEFENLCKEYESSISLLNPMDREKSIEFIRETKIFVLPSRTEAMGRVLLEASSAMKGIIGSRVDGIPHYIKEGETGLLFESEDIQGLANCLDKLLSNEELYNSLSKKAYQEVHDKYTEERYALNLYNMVKDIL